MMDKNCTNCDYYDISLDPITGETIRKCRWWKTFTSPTWKCDEWFNLEEKKRILAEQKEMMKKENSIVLYR